MSAFLSDPFRPCLLRQSEKSPMSKKEAVSWTTFSPQGDWLAVGEENGRLSLWPLDPRTPHDERVLHMEGPDGQFPPALRR